MNAQPATIPACEVCGRERTRIVDRRPLCGSDSCLQVAQGTTDKDKVGGEGGRGLYAVPSPSVSSPVSELRREEPELYGLVRDYDRGELEAVPVTLGELPAGASAAMRQVAEDVALLLGLRLAVDEDRPLPYSARLCAKRCELIRDHGHASRVLRSLERAGVIRCAGKLKPRGMPFGTKLYRAPA